jgi:cytochrome P450
MAAAEGGDRLSETELVQLFETLLVGGTDTTTSALTNALLLFTQHPEQWAWLAEDPELVPSAVEEVLRCQPVTLGTVRVARDDVDYNGLHISAGTQLIIAHGAFNFDPAVYDAPETFDIRRFADGARVPKPNHMTFGFGAHVCIGNYLARLELQEALKVLPQRMPGLRVDESDPRGVERTSPFSIYGAWWLPLRWDVAG